MEKNVLAFDLGASSGRAILGQYQAGTLKAEEIHRFSNGAVEKEGTLFWDLDYLFQEILVALEKASSRYKIDSVGFDTWGVDFAALDENGKLIQDPVSYRDSRTKGMLEFVKKNYLSDKELFDRTGNQLMEINSLFQLLAFKKDSPDLFEKTAHILNMPDLFNYLLTGKIKSEISIASTSQMLNPIRKTWDKELLGLLDLPSEILPDLTSEGEILGEVKPEYTKHKIEVINVCEHDTASAVVSVPTQEESFIFVSCGTWSLIGTEIEAPILTEKTYRYNLTNESGQGGTTRLLKNCTGLWIIQELKKEFEEKGDKYDYRQIAEMAGQATAFRTFINTEDPRFAIPGQMIEKVQAFAEETNQPVPETAAQLFRSVYEGLAFKYKETIDELVDVTNKDFETVYIVGGGSQAEIFCQMVANAANMDVSAGPAEATALGNIAIQLKAHGVFESVKEIRAWVSEQEIIKRYCPDETGNWSKSYLRYKELFS